MEEIFPRYGLYKVWTKVDTAEDFPCLPDGLFDQILQKSTDMWWAIRPEQLVICLINRHKLKWRNLDYFLRDVPLKATQVNFILSSLPKPSQLCLNFESKGIKALEDVSELMTLMGISQLADSLESLKICLSQTFLPKIIERNPLQKGDESKLKLKQFFYNANLESFPVLLDSSTLITLFLDNSCLTKSSLEMVKLFKNLVHLSLYSTTLHNISFSDVLDTVFTLTNLRILNITSDWAYFEPGENLVVRIISNLSRLEILEISSITSNFGGDWPTDRKLKVLIALGAIDISRENLMNLTHKAANFASLERTLNVCGFTSNSNALRISRMQLGLFLRTMSMRNAIDSSTIDFKRMEQIIAIFVRHLQSYLESIDLCTIFDALGPRYFSPEFIEKAICLIGSSNVRSIFNKSLMKSFSDFLQGNQSTHVRRKLVKIVAESI